MSATRDAYDDAAMDVQFREPRWSLSLGSQCRRYESRLISCSILHALELAERLKPNSRPSPRRELPVCRYNTHLAVPILKRLLKRRWLIAVPRYPRAEPTIPTIGIKTSSRYDVFRCGVLRL